MAPHLRRTSTLYVGDQVQEKNIKTFRWGWGKGYGFENMIPHYDSCIVVAVLLFYGGRVKISYLRRTPPHP